MKIGIIGAEQIGSALIRQYSQIGHEVKMTNAIGIEKLKKIEVETGTKAVSLTEVATDVEVLALLIPLIEIPKLSRSLCIGLPANTVVIDTTNYYPIRDGVIGEL